MKFNVKIFIDCFQWLLSIIVIVYIVFIVISGDSNSINVDQFKPYIANYLNQAEQIISTSPKNKQINIKGPLLLIDKDSNNVASCFDDFPSDIVARTPETVQTLIIYEYKGVKRKGSFNFGSVTVFAGVHSWNETIVDIKTNAIISINETYDYLPQEIKRYDIDFIKGKKPNPGNHYKEIIIDGKSAIVEKRKWLPCYNHSFNHQEIKKLAGYPKINLNPFNTFHFNDD